MKKHYHHIKFAYKNICYNSVFKAYCVSMKAFTDFMERAGATDDNLKISEIRLNFITSYSTSGVT